MEELTPMRLELRHGRLCFTSRYSKEWVVVGISTCISDLERGKVVEQSIKMGHKPVAGKVTLVPASKSLQAIFPWLQRRHGYI